MTISFTQTDTAAVCGAAAYCSGNSLNTNRSLRQATIGGTPGTTAVSQSIDSGAINLIAVFFECIVGAGVSWDAGTWTINLNVTTGTSGTMDWTGLDICRLNSSCVSQASIATASPSVSVTTTGVKTVTVSGSAQSPSAGDKVMVLLSFSQTGPTRSFSYTPNVTIDSPFSGITTTPNSLMLTGVGT
jgi:hypothetical protein